MSLLHVIDDVITRCKAEECRLTETIRQNKRLLHSMRTCVRDIGELEPAAAISTREDVLPEEQQEIELLDEVLRKALRIRSTSEAHKELPPDRDIQTRPNKSRNKSTINDAVKVKDERNPMKSASSESCGKLSHRVRSAGGSVTRGPMWTRPVVFRKGSTASPAVRGKQSVPVKISSTASQQKISVKTTTTKGSSEEHSTLVSCQTHCKEDITSTAGRSQSNEHWIPSPLLPALRSQREKQSRLWKKVLVQQSRPAAERTGFTQRLRSTFPTEWPSGCPANVRRELEVLTQRCLDLTHLFHAELQTQQTDPSCAAGSEPGERQYESSLMLEGLERLTEDLLTCADQQMKDWERWNKCHSETLCPVRKRGEWSDPDCSSLPPVLSYSSETQLRELERLRLHVEYLQQAVRLQQVMSDNLASYWTVTGSGPDLSAVVLRGLYSLLAEGGLQVPSLVLDSE